MSNDKAWTDEWLKAQQKFVESWSEMGKGRGKSEQNDQANLWANGLEMWRKTYPYPYQTQPETDQVINKCLEVGKGYFAMAEQIGKQMSAGGKPEEVIQQWLEQLKSGLQQHNNHWSPMQHQASYDFVSQWMGPSSSWQKIATAMMPMQMPGADASIYGIGENFDELNQALSMPGIGFFRESQEKQQAGIKLAMAYQQSNHLFNQSFLRVSIESLQSFQKLLTELTQNDKAETPHSLRALYDLWVDVSERCYADYAMSEEYQRLYGDMVNRLMKLKKHYSEMHDEVMASMNLPSRKEIDTMQQRLQETRRDNRALRRELRELREMLTDKKPPVNKFKVKKAVVKKKVRTKSRAGTRT